LTSAWFLSSLDHAGKVYRNIEGDAKALDCEIPGTAPFVLAPTLRCNAAYDAGSYPTLFCSISYSITSSARASKA
jgi:hypothetical protein